MEHVRFWLLQKKYILMFSYFVCFLRILGSIKNYSAPYIMLWILHIKIAALMYESIPRIPSLLDLDKMGGGGGKGVV